MKTGAGTPIQSSMVHQQADTNHLRMRFPVLGVVLNVFVADDPLNESSQWHGGDGYSGSRLEAEVMVVSDNRYTLSNVIITPPGSSGFDNFSEEVPKGVTGLTDSRRQELLRAPLTALDGDWCIIDWINGSFDHPFMVSWYPHPASLTDPTTSNALDTGNLPQGRRCVKRFQGTTFCIASDGSIYIDTGKANSKMVTGERKESEEGGDIRVSVKPTRELEVNFNPAVLEVDSDGNILAPDILHPRGATPQTRGNNLTRLLMDQEFLTALAGRVMALGSFESLHFGREGTADEPFVLGAAWQTMMYTVLMALAVHSHPTGVGPSGFPHNSAIFENAANNLAEQLSDWIFGQKAVPTPC